MKHKVNSVGQSLAKIGKLDEDVTSSHLSRLAFSIREASQLLGISARSVRRLIDRGLIKSSRALRTHMIQRSELDRFLSGSNGTEIKINS